MRNIEELFANIFSENREIDYEGLNDKDFWTTEELLEQEFRKGLEIDDLCLSAFASNTYGDPRIHGRFRFCVYGGIKYQDLKEKLENMKSPILKVMDIYHPEQTYGISFNGVYENEDTTYIGGKYELRKGGK